MHILVTNDDGPPSAASSPYVHCLVKHLQDAGHTVSVCLPHTQRSWIGKAHMIGQTLKPTYYRPSIAIHGEDAMGTIHPLPSASGDIEEWILIDGTPASCVQIGLHHFFQDRGPIDLVVSGPNYGRNTTAVFALSSGTMGAALEAAVCTHKAIALSFAFFSRNHDPVIIEEACRQSVKVVEALYKQWPNDGSVDLYSVNVPLIEGVEKNKTLFTDILQNYWRDGGCFEEIEGTADDGPEEEKNIREGATGEVSGGQPAAGAKKGHVHKHFKWVPKFAGVYQSVEEAPPGNDGWAVKEGFTSVTAMKANFACTGVPSGSKELQLEAPRATQELPIRVKEQPNDLQSRAIKVIVAYEDSYVQPLILSAISSVFPKDLVEVSESIPEPQGASWLSKVASEPNTQTLSITSYEQIDFEFASSNSRSCLINSYMIRKALIRKHFLSTTVDYWVAKRPGSLLKNHVKRSEAFEVDFAEFLDDALIEAFDLRESLEQNETSTDSSQRQWWILKPGMSDRGQGIRLFSTMEELQGIFDEWEEDQPDTDDEGEDATGENEDDRDGIMTSHLRHFVAQPYIHPPLLINGDNRKFHIRTYVACSGGLSVYVYRHMLALFAAKAYSSPWTSPDDIETFLTNTCLQSSPNGNTVQRFWDLALPKSTLESIFEQICDVTGEVFEAAAVAMPIHFQALPNAFEVFGLDFMVDSEGSVWLLEVNAFPDFKQTGGDLQEIVRGFWEGVMRSAVAPFFGVEDRVVGSKENDGDMVLAKKVDLGRG